MGLARLALSGPFAIGYMVQLAATAKPSLRFRSSPPFVIRQMGADKDAGE